MSSQPDPSVVLDLIQGFRLSKTMFTAVRLGVFDALESGPQDVLQLAKLLKLNAPALSRLLDGCVSLKLLEREGELYRNTESASTYLVQSSPETFQGYIVYSDESLFPLWSHLDDAVREGTNRWEQTFGSRDALFDHYYRDPAATRNFVRAMHGFGRLASPQIVRAFDLSRFHQIVDLGGATGHLVIAACEKHPDLRGTVVDLPRVQPLAHEFISKSPVADRVQFITLDFFKDDLPSGDLYALGRIVHDWSDAEITPLLAKIYQALPMGGALLLAEALLNDDRQGPVYALMQDLNMLVCTNGHERTAGEYQALLMTAGFATVESRRTGTLVDAVLGRKR